MQQTWVSPLFCFPISKELKVWLHIPFTPQSPLGHSSFWKMQLFPSAQSDQEQVGPLAISDIFLCFYFYFFLDKSCYRELDSSPLD